jgi:uncharacterized membrane protein
VLIVVALVLPLAGAMTSLWHSRSLLLLFLIAAIMPIIAVTWLKSDAAFMIAIACISLFLLLSATMTSDNLLGWDIHQEYSIFREVLREGVWRPSVNIPYNSVLSVSILPVMLNLVSGLDGIGIFKIIYPLLFSMVPVVLYKMYRNVLPPVAAFLSVFLYMSYPNFYVEHIALARQEVAELLLALSLCVILSAKIRGAGRSTMILLLAVGIVTAHYSLAYVYIFVLMFSFMLSSIFGRTRQLVDLLVIAIVGSITTVWYIFLASGTEFYSLLNFFLFLGANLGEFFNPFTRPTVVLAAIGIGASPGLLHYLNRISYYLVDIVLAAGFLLFVRKRHKSVEESKMLSIMTFGIVLMGSLVALPYFAEALNFTRTYGISLLLASPCFGYGAASLPGLGRKRLGKLFPHDLPHIRVAFSSRWVLAASILLSFFLFSSGWVWAVSMDTPTSFVLDSDRFLTYPDPVLRTAYFGYFTLSEDIAGAQWLSAHRAIGRSLCADSISTDNVMASYGGIPRIFVYLGPSPYDCSSRRSLVYLSVLNTRYSTWTTAYTMNNTLPMSAVDHSLATMNKLYSNGGTTILG